MAQYQAFTTQELVALLGFAGESGLRYRATTENWRSQPRQGRGGGSEWILSSMPSETQETIVQALVRASIAKADAEYERKADSVNNADEADGSNLPAIPEDGFSPLSAEDAEDARRGAISRLTSLAKCTQRQRDAVFARLTCLREVERLAVVIGLENAREAFLATIEKGEASKAVLEAIQLASGRNGETISRRTLCNWRSQYVKGGEAALIPKYPTARLDFPVWGETLLSFYRRPQKPTVAQAHRELCTMYADGELRGTPPSIHAVRRWIKKIALPELQRGRKTGNALLGVMPHKHRDTKHMYPCDCYTADGTTFDAEIVNPINGLPFKPEVTLVIDVATRRCVGASFSLAEDTQSILDALRMACTFGGVPAMFYADNGPGYSNHILTAKGTGMLDRLGIERCRSIPGRPQGKGLMERAVKTVCEPVSKVMTTCSHRDMDKDMAKKVYKITREDIKRGYVPRLMPTWEEFKNAMISRIAEYNATPHRSLPMFEESVNGRMRRRHMSPDEYWQNFIDHFRFTPVSVPQEIAFEEFLPAVRRTVRNGKVSFGGATYFSHELSDYHGDYVMVRYDVWDARKVYLWTTNGRRICDAELNGNSIPYFQQSQIDSAREKRAKAQLKRLEQKASGIVPGAYIALPEQPFAITADTLCPPKISSFQSTGATGAPVTVDVAPIIEPRPTFSYAYERYEWLMRNTDRWTAKDGPWLEEYALSDDYADSHERYVYEGIAWNSDSNTQKVGCNA